MFGCFWTNGQICSATSRLLVQDSIYDRFLALLVQEANKIIVGDALAEGVKMGPIVCAAQYDKIMGFIERAKAQGVRVAAGGVRPAVRGATVMERMCHHHHTNLLARDTPVHGTRHHAQESDDDADCRLPTHHIQTGPPSRLLRAPDGAGGRGAAPRGVDRPFGKGPRWPPTTCEELRPCV
jgi:hypothetical protein